LTTPSQIVAESGSNNHSFPSFAVDGGLKISGYANFEGSEQVLSMPSPLVEAIPTTSTSNKDFERGKVVDAGTLKLFNFKGLKYKHSNNNLFDTQTRVFNTTRRLIGKKFARYSLTTIFIM